jgi:hypothetical protein
MTKGGFDLSGSDKPAAAERALIVGMVRVWQTRLVYRAGWRLWLLPRNVFAVALLSRLASSIEAGEHLRMSEQSL